MKHLIIVLTGYYNKLIISFVTSLVVALPPKSPVNTFASVNSFKIAFSSLSADSSVMVITHFQFIVSVRASKPIASRIYQPVQVVVRVSVVLHPTQSVGKDACGIVYVGDVAYSIVIISQPLHQLVICRI